MSESRVPADETAEQRFKRLAVARVNRALKDIALVGNLSGSQYAKTDNDIDLIEVALTSAVAGTMQRLRNVKTDRPQFNL